MEEAGDGGGKGRGDTHQEMELAAALLASSASTQSNASATANPPAGPLSRATAQGEASQARGSPPPTSPTPPCPFAARHPPPLPASLPHRRHERPRRHRGLW